jgi:hypothetical protein
MTKPRFSGAFYLFGSTIRDYFRAITHNVKNDKDDFVIFVVYLFEDYLI